MIATDKLLIRRYTPDDLPKLHALLSDPVTMQFWPAAFTFEQSEQWMTRNMESYSQGYGRMAVILRENQEIVGDAGLLKYEIDGVLENDLGYIISSAYWNRGFGFEAAEAVMKHGFEELGLKRICANMPVDHIASRKVAEKLGMTLEKQFLNRRNRNLPTCLYAIERN
ncbi:N-acetyltransferase [Paenibacillus nanensis]|uniref:N-acetyltransferase n=1 Tax=Paenibacillus nanensis TaxID=393251 RepID=A0A3A1USK4_9BACL|nr:GNAT family N-acetyltransferase [Paenibacillus nanensis]RIX50162.1 N-acetyltransferase [Paenibacillus nanensis]